MNGYSMQLCVSDIARGVVPERNVGVIYSAATFNDEQSLDLIAAAYMQSRGWGRNEAKIAKRLYRAGKLISDPTTAKAHMPYGGHWEK